MSPTKLRYRSSALAALALAAAAVPSAALAATPAQDPLPVAPNQYFIGLVNGKSSDAVITLVCPGPATPGQTGHPLAGQTVEVENPVPIVSLPGYTGSAAHQIDAEFNLATAANIDPAIVLGAYYVKEDIPTTDVFPCSGSGAVTFVPLPTSPTARSYTVSVTFANIAD